MSNVRMSFLEANIWSTTLIDGNDFQTRPCDNITCLNGKLFAIEGKFQKDFSAFGLGNIRDSQSLNLDAITKGFGVASIFLNIWIPHKENRLLIWHWPVFKERATRSSFKKDELINMPYIKGSNKRFPVHEILEIINKF